MINNITYITADDDLLCTLMLQQYASNFDTLLHKGSYNCSTEALVAIQAIKPSLVFLDIEMPGLSGLDVLRKVKSIVPMAIFITSHPEYALEGFELSALDYIMKPLTPERFSQCMKRVTEFWEMKNKAALYEIAFEKDAIVIKDGHNKIMINRSDIIYAEAMQDYTKIVTIHKNYMTLSTLGNFLEQFADDNLIRVHRSYVVSKKAITSIKNNEVICNKYEIPIGKTYKTTLAQFNL